MAHELGKTESEIRALPPGEFERWIAYFQIQDENRKRMANKPRPAARRR